MRGSKDLSLIHSLNTLLLVSCVVFRGGFSCCRAAVWQQRQQSLIVVFHLAPYSFLAEAFPCYSLLGIRAFSTVLTSYEHLLSEFTQVSPASDADLGWSLLSRFSALRLGLVPISLC